jgi:hypothetical protein
VSVHRGVAFALLRARLGRGQDQLQDVLFGPDEQATTEDATGQLARVGDQAVEGDAPDEIGDVRFGQARVGTRVGEAGRLGEGDEGPGEIWQVHGHDRQGTRQWP